MLIIDTVVAILLIDFIGFCVASQESFHFNPKENYEYWYSLNWFGVWFVTILYWIVFLPFTIIYFIFWLFTVGRK